jgi:hypothetical protein
MALFVTCNRQKVKPLEVQGKDRWEQQMKNNEESACKKNKRDMAGAMSQGRTLPQVLAKTPA